MAHRIEERGILAQANQRGRFLYVQLTWLLIKIGVGSRLDANGIVQEVEVVQVERDDFLFRVITLQLHGNHPLDGLLQQAFQL